MEWTADAENLLATLGRMVPETLRELATSAAHDEAEAVAEEQGASEVGADEVMRGWIRSTPPEQRNGLIAVIEDLGLEPERYADELENAEGWDDETADEEED